jgi:alginate O-acetyltransferase complex protein AlgI
VIFPTIEFCLFFLVVLPVSWALMGRPAPWKLFLLGASYFFYASADWKFVFLLGGVTLGNHLFARLIHRSDDARRRKQFISAAITLDLGVLAVFKYYGFFVEELTGALDGIGMGAPLPVLQIALPIGVSFFTFQAISYVMDVYRRELAPPSLLDAALYISFFPQLVAGPIVRATEFLPQLTRPRDPSRVAVGAGIVLIVIGLVKKVAIADTLAREVVDPVFAVPEAYGSADVLLAIYAYAAQIYCDFSGYTDMAIGVALLMGLSFPKNFDRPYSAKSLQEFWQRWHMTLSRFLRDYLYIPLGGNRTTRARSAVNLWVTMVLCGIWHGAAWGFVVFGILHGTFMVMEREAKFRLSWRPPAWLACGFVVSFFAFTLVPFRTPDLATAGAVLSQLAQEGAATLWNPVPVLMVLLVIGGQMLPPRPIDALRLRIANLPIPALAGGLAISIMIVAATIPSQGVPPFIYFQF